MHETLTELQRYLLGLGAIGVGVLAAIMTGARPSAPDAVSARGQRIAGGVLVLACSLYLLYLAVDLAHPLWVRAARRDDAVRYYVIANRVLDELPLYWPWLDYGPHYATPGYRYPAERYPYPPFLMGVLAPLAKLPLASFARVWYLVLYTGFGIYAACLARLATGRITPARVVVAAAVLAAVPGSQLALMVANIEPVMWAFFGAALAFPLFRGTGFAASAMIKLYGGWPLLVAFAREGKRVFLGALLALVVGTAAGLVVLGPADFLNGFVDWARYMVPVVGQGTFAFDPQYGGTNVSFSFAVLRVIRALGWEYHPGPLPGWARTYLTVTAIGAPLLAIWLTRRTDPVLRYALVTAAAVLFAPLCWATYLPLLLAPLARSVRLWGLQSDRAART